MADRGTFEDLRAHVDALVNSVNSYRAETAELDLQFRALEAAFTRMLVKLDKIEDELDTRIHVVDINGDAL